MLAYVAIRGWGHLIGGFTMYAPKSLVRDDSQDGKEDVILSVVTELIAISERLVNMGPMERGSLKAAASGDAVADRQAQLFALADEELRRRKLRARFLPAQFFGEAAWSMLLDLYVSEFRKRPVATTSACIAGDVPASTALRWLDLLEQRALIERYESDRDRRVKFIRLTAEGRNALEAILSSY